MLPTSVNNILAAVAVVLTVAGAIYSATDRIVRDTRGRLLFVVGILVFFVGLMQLCFRASSPYSQGLSFFLIVGLMIGGGLLAAWGRHIGNT